MVFERVKDTVGNGLEILSVLFGIFVQMFGVLKKITYDKVKPPNIDEFNEEDYIEWVEASLLCNLAYYPKNEIEKIESVAKIEEETDGYTGDNDEKRVDLLELWPAFREFKNDYELIIDDDTGTDLYVMCNGRRLVIAFCGTEELMDFVTDAVLTYDIFEFCQDHESKDLNVHSGFNQQYKAVRGRIRDYMETKCAEHDLIQVLITGHSLGGGLATLCSLDFTRNPVAKQPPLRIIPIASPAVGDQEFANYYNSSVKDCCRLTLPYDPVKDKFMGYEHVGQEVTLHDDGDAWGVQKVATSHSIISYINATKKAKDHKKKCLPSRAKITA